MPYYKYKHWCIEVLRGADAFAAQREYIDYAAELIVRSVSQRPIGDKSCDARIKAGVLCLDSVAPKVDLNGRRIETEPGLNAELLGDPAKVFSFPRERDPSPKEIGVLSHRQVEIWMQENLRLYITDAVRQQEDVKIRGEDEI